MNETDKTETDAAVSYGAAVNANETAGRRLRARREEFGLNVRDLAGITRIPATHLTYLEEDRFEEFSAEVFCRGFLKNYARELRLDESEIVSLYERQTGRERRTMPVVDMTEAAPAIREEGRFAHPSATGRALYALGLALFVIGLALSVLVFGGDSRDSTAASYSYGEANEAWQPVPAGTNDWQTQREN